MPARPEQDLTSPEQILVTGLSNRGLPFAAIQSQPNPTLFTFHILPPDNKTKDKHNRPVITLDFTAGDSDHTLVLTSTKAEALIVFCMNCVMAMLNTPVGELSPMIHRRLPQLRRSYEKKKDLTGHRLPPQLCLLLNQFIRNSGIRRSERVFGHKSANPQPLDATPESADNKDDGSDDDTLY